MRKTFTLILIITVISMTSKAANDNYPFGGRAAGMGNASVTLYDFWAISHNQAGLARLENMAAGVFFENRFLVEELSFGAGAFVLPTSSGVFGVSFTYFGFELYNETKVGVAYGREFGERFSTGIQLNYHNTGIGEDYGNKGNLTFELGIIFHISPELSIGAHIFNPTRAKIGDFADERIPTIFKTGLAYEFSERVMVIAEAEKSVNLDPVFKVGIEYRISDPVYLRGGIGTNPMTNAFGFGLEVGNLNIDLATSYHHILGYSPQISFVYHFK
ncbi:MAG: hypothetical protein EA361_08240 [Bacteroidetes bacterium]|nr:MAG: hypothetical protein EA361_08240 [Bacteroidota bacterium]